MMVRRILHHFRQRHQYRHPRDWLIAIYDRLLLRWQGIHFPFRGMTCSLNLCCLSRPLYLRLGTSDLWVIEEIFFKGEYRPLLKTDLGPIRTVIDLGANAGYSLRFWESTLRPAKVVGVEPDEANIRVCRLNVAGGTVGTKFSIQRAFAVGNERKLFLDRSGREWEYKATEQAEPGAEEVPSISMERLFQDCGFEKHVDLLKCDIEGGEAELFGSCSKWIRNVRLLFVETHRPYSVEKLRADISRAGGEFEVVDSSQKGDCETVLLRSVQQKVTCETT